MRKLSLLLFIVFSCFLLNAQQLLKENSSGLAYLVKQGNNGNVVILMHGYGSNENDLFSFAQYFPSGTTIVCPRAPLTYSKTSYAWYDITFKENGNHQRNLNQGNESAEKIKLFVEAIKSKYNVTGYTVVGGFSQGAIMSLNLAVANPTLIDGIIGLSGTLLHENLKPLPELKDEYKKLNAFYAHGTKDQLLPLKHGLACKNLIEICEMKLEYHEYPIEHNISSAEIHDLIKWYSTNF